jgi:hypothetical protein
MTCAEIALLHDSGDITNLQGDTHLKNGTGRSSSRPPTLPPVLHAMVATNGTKRPCAHAASEAVYCTSLHSANAWESGTGHDELTGAHMESYAALVPVRSARSRVATLPLASAALIAALSNTTHAEAWPR